MLIIIYYNLCYRRNYCLKSLSGAVKYQDVLLSNNATVIFSFGYVEKGNCRVHQLLDTWILHYCSKIIQI